MHSKQMEPYAVTKKNINTEHLSSRANAPLTHQIEFFLLLSPSTKSSVAFINLGKIFTLP